MSSSESFDSDGCTDSSEIRLVVCGSRSLVDRFGGFLNTREQAVVVERAIQCSPFDRSSVAVVLSGANQRSPDAWGESWAKMHDSVGLELYEAEWDAKGRKAGILRNEEMAVEADAVLAFWDGESSGTEHMLDCGRDNGCDTAVVPLNKESVFQPLLGDLVE